MSIIKTINVIVTKQNPDEITINGMSVVNAYSVSSCGDAVLDPVEIYNEALERAWKEYSATVSVHLSFPAPMLPFRDIVGALTIDAYSRRRYGDECWFETAEHLAGIYDWTAEQVAEVLNSKVTRWAADYYEDGNGVVPVWAMTKYLRENEDALKGLDL